MARGESVFTYSLARPYPFRWFTTTAVLGGVLTLALFSYLNYAANGFELQTITSSDLNATLADRSELRGLPAPLTGKYAPKCQPTSLDRYTRFYTNNTGLVYTITGISQERDPDTVYSTLVYSRNILEACNVTAVEIQSAQLDRNANQIAFTEYGATVRTSASCAMSTVQGKAMLIKDMWLCG